MSFPDLHRVALSLHYVGTAFHGWQVQPAVRTVQGEIEAVLERLTGEQRTLLGSGRTDAGVHATGQIAIVDLPVRWSAERVRSALNALLPGDVWVADARIVGASFHPRYDATARSYEYRIGLAPEAFSPFHRPFCWALGGELDRGALDRAAALLPGEHSFRAFAKAGQPERGEHCTVHAAAWADWNDLGVCFRVTANRYLHHMVRYLVGTMVEIARGRRPLADLRSLLAAPNPDLITSPPAPPEGLYLTRVTYPADADLSISTDSSTTRSAPTP